MYNEIEVLRICSKCQYPVDEEEFSLCVKCRDIQAKAMRTWRSKNLAKSRAYQAEWNRNLRKEVLEHYGGKCVCCQEDTFEFLAIDHIEGGGNQHRKEIGMPSGSPMIGWLKRNGFPEGFQVMCHNCNLAKGFYGQCPHVMSRY